VGTCRGWSLTSSPRMPPSTSSNSNSRSCSGGIVSHSCAAGRRLVDVHLSSLSGQSDPSIAAVRIEGSARTNRRRPAEIDGTRCDVCLA
jgi:hypothetical protein